MVDRRHRSVEANILLICADASGLVVGLLAILGGARGLDLVGLLLLT